MFNCTAVEFLYLSNDGRTSVEMPCCGQHVDGMKHNCVYFSVSDGSLSSKFQLVDAFYSFTKCLSYDWSLAASVQLPVLAPM